MFLSPQTGDETLTVRPPPKRAAQPETMKEAGVGPASGWKRRSCSQISPRSSFSLTSFFSKGKEKASPDDQTPRNNDISEWAAVLWGQGKAS